MLRSIGISTYKLTAVLLALALAFARALAEETPRPGAIADSPLEDDGVVRVLLRSLGAPEVIGLRVAGEYAVEGDAGFRFERGAEVALFARGGDVWLRAGRADHRHGQLGHLDAPRGGGRAENGLYIAQAKRENLYEGDLSVPWRTGGLRAVLAIGIEDYLRGVIAYEMSDSFPVEALKAQAVAARTYAMQRKYASGGRDYDVTDTTGDQVVLRLRRRARKRRRGGGGHARVVGVYQGGVRRLLLHGEQRRPDRRAGRHLGRRRRLRLYRAQGRPLRSREPPQPREFRVLFRDLSDCAALREMLEEALADELDGEWALEGVLAVERPTRRGGQPDVPDAALHARRARPRAGRFRGRRRPDGVSGAGSGLDRAAGAGRAVGLRADQGRPFHRPERRRLRADLRRAGRGRLHAGNAPLRPRRRHEPARRAVDGRGVRRDVAGNPRVLLSRDGAGAHRLQRRR